MLDSLLDPKNGTAGLLAGLIVILCFHLVLTVGKFVFELAKKKNEASERQIEKMATTVDQTIALMRQMDSRITAMERDMNEVLKFRLDFKRLFSAVKFIAGDQWPEAKKAMKDYDFE